MRTENIFIFSIMVPEEYENDLQEECIAVNISSKMWDFLLLLSFFKGCRGRARIERNCNLFLFDIYENENLPGFAIALLAFIHLSG